MFLSSTTLSWSVYWVFLLMGIILLVLVVVLCLIHTPLPSGYVSIYSCGLSVVGIQSQSTALPGLARVFTLAWFLDIELTFALMLVVVWLLDVSLASAVMVILGELLIVSILQVGQLLSSDLI